MGAKCCAPSSSPAPSPDNFKTFLEKVWFETRNLEKRWRRRERDQEKLPINIRFEADFQKISIYFHSQNAPFFRVNASERRVEYRYQSETLLYDFEETTKREQLETWQSKRRVQAPTTAVVTMVRKTQSLQEKADFQELLGTRRREI
ncbi:Protein CBG15817 [Caenorhabditis briggsae]|uniref:Protein CBG15817 n=1 Tax=Caenorhabditis briggsae TaxID=6238 RepID=A8XMY5_CAEBR|nr:Protein CBG15817 [Caenorhabditis briggsae]CAP34010.2 Protein CBG15817 [Caenorhabditis briggsae]